MRILQIINSLSAGGAEAFVVSLAIAQAQAGHQVYVYTYAGSLDRKGDELKRKLLKKNVHYISSATTVNLGKFLLPIKIRMVIANIKPDIVHSHLEQSDFFSALARLMSPKFRFVRTIHSVYAIKSLPNFVHRWIARQSDLDVACGEAVFDTYPFLSCRRAIVNNGIHIEDLEPDQAKCDVRRNLNVKDHETLFINIGSFGLRANSLPKSQDIIVKALGQLEEKAFKMVFLGDGEQIDNIKMLAKSCGVENECIFVGQVASVKNYLNAADAVVMPSRFEGLSIGCIEAVCSNKPVIASNITAFKLFGYPSTLYVEPESVNSLVQAFREFISTKKELIAEAEIYGSDYRSIFDIETVAKNYVLQYEEILS